MTCDGDARLYPLRFDVASVMLSNNKEGERCHGKPQREESIPGKTWLILYETLFESIH